MAGVSISRAVPWPPPTSSLLPDLRFHHGKSAEGIAGEDGKMSPMTVEETRGRHVLACGRARELKQRDDMQMHRDLAAKALVLHARQGIGIGLAGSGAVRSRGDCGLSRQALTSRPWIRAAPRVANLCSVVLGFGGRPREES